ncbi:MOSC domain-containing protein [Palleronia caenipelagi]|uniref:MOSC domain-containing protein n=1 Tax=Palleronia caenipelagi TaxID=2489174 RepID=A0A547Q747_9RHOB|nr:MOSC domain-containing protein [Palleronia caenipelagi]TRD22191.1 MOSC domain-containing protein [Palleronia caenipelagi]
MKVTDLWRYPLKGLGRERLEQVYLTTDSALPGDRAWAVRHANGVEAEGWRPCNEFLRTASGPLLAAVELSSNGDTLTLIHPERPAGRFALPEDGAQLIDWVRPLWPESRPAPVAVVPGPASTGMSDNGQATLSILNQSSLNALSACAGVPVDQRRFRGNIVIDGAEPWAEFNWIGKRLTLGSITVEVTEVITRCRATEASPETGTRDVNTLAILRDQFGHQDFGVYARVVSGGSLAVGDAVALA